VKAPKFPSYDEAVNRKKKKHQNLLSKEEWQTKPLLACIF